MIIPDPDEFVLTFFGAVSVGVVPVPMYPPLALGKLDGFHDTARRILGASGSRLLVTTKQVQTILWSLIVLFGLISLITLVDLVTALDAQACGTRGSGPFD